MSRFYGSPASTAVGLSPSATVTATKGPTNPTANFVCLIENPINVSGTYYAAYINGDGNIYLATASSVTGPWTAGVSPIFSVSTISWSGFTASQIAAPFLIYNPDSGHYTIFYDAVNSASTDRRIGFIASSSITGPYSDHGSPILAGGGGSTWDANGACEPSVTYDATNWYMAYMGYNTPSSPADSEHVGFASIARSGLGIAQTWTKNSDNPIAYGATGQWNEAIMADPTIFQENGYFWTWCLGTTVVGGSFGIGAEGLYYTTTPLTTASWTEHPSSPILSPTAGSWDAKRCFRGGILIPREGAIGGLYTGGTDTTTFSTYRGGYFQLNIT